MDSIYIKNFKNFRELTIEKVGKVNLIVGKNNVGKSSLLEAISIYITNGEENWLRKLLADRGENIFDVDNDEVDIENIKQHYISLFTGWEENYNKTYEIEIGTREKGEDSVRISQVYIREVKNSSATFLEALGEEDIANSSNRNSVTAAGIMVRNDVQGNIIPYGKRRGYLNVFNEKCPFRHILVDEIYRESNAKQFDKISLSPDEAYVLEALKIINPAINNRTAF